ncbi:MAG: rhodanese-like domain-containing protein [Acidobacteria bacterium]|nr:rhodanese-like domain-containing protein [Acidobacteriota bacterium]
MPTTLERREQPTDTSELRPIARDELTAKIDRGESFALVETLSPEQFREGHLPRAVNVPADRVSELAPSLLPDKQAEIVTYCSSRTCHAPSDVARELMAMGYANVRHYAGGKADWTFAGLPIER